jgi:hypothetical protein
VRLSKASAVALLAFALCFGMLGSAFGQAGTTGVYGDVKDQQGAVVVGATVTVVNLATGAERTTKTDATGAYQFRGLAPGLYRVKVDAAGFRSTVHDNVQLGVDTPARLPVALTVGAAAEVMEVVAAAATVNTIDGAIGNPISALQVQELPTEARNPVVLLSLQPGAIYLPGQEVTDPRSGSVSGSRADQGNVTLDGVDVNDPQFNTAFTSALRMTQDAIQEFKVTTTGFGAEQGRSSGAQVSLVTRSGTSELHGAGYWAHRNTVFSSNEYFNKLSQVSNGLPNEAPLLQKHVWGARLGGPVIKDRFFLFGNIENLREKSQESVLRDIPSNSFRDGFLIYECVDPSLCPATMVTGPSGRTYNIASGFRLLSNTELIQLDPLSLGVNTNALAYFNQYPLQNDSGNFDGINFAGFRFAAPLANQFWTYIARADFHVDRNANHKVFWRGNLQDDVTNSAPQFPGLAPNTQFTNNSKGFALGYTGVFGSNIVNNFRYGYTRLDVATVGLWDSNRVTFRFFDPFNALTSTNGRDAITHNFTNDLSLVKGSHTWQFGVNFRFTRIPQFTNAISFHQAIANGSWNQETGTRFIPGVCSHTDAAKATFCNSLPAAADQATFADAFTNILGVVNQVNARYNFNRDGSPLPAGEAVRRRFATNEYEFYAQDSWRLHPTFTLTLGVRYSLYTPVWETNGLQVAPTINTSEWFEIRRRAQDSGQSTGLGVPLLEFDLAGPANDKPHYYEYDKNNIAPRVAFAWMPNFQDGILGAITGRGRMNIRGGFGMVYDRVGHALAARFDTVGSFGLATLLRTGFGQNNEDTPGIRFVNETTMPPQTPPPPAPAPFPKQPALFNGAIEEGIDRGLRTPYTYLMNMAVSRELPWHMQMEMAYVGRVGVKLTTRRDLAMIANITDPASGLDYFGAVAELFRQMDALGISRTSPASAYTAITNVPYWQNLFPGFSGTVSGVPLTATQRIARAYSRFTNGSDVIWAMDQFCSIDFVTFGPCGTLGDFAYFTPQYDSLAALSSVGYSDYHALQATLRKRMSNGLLFDINYSFAKALDIGSNTERGSGFTTFGAGGVSGFLLDSWNPRKQYGRSDFDVRHNVNANWIFELPFGQGRRYALSGVANAIAGGWSLSGLWRWTSGFPFSVGNGRRWPTNWNLTGNAEQAFGATAYPATGTTHGAVQGQPSPFVDPAAAFDLFRFARPGEVGIRNTLDGDGYIAIDLGIGKDWTMPWLENHKLRFRWDIFNITNTASFDVATLTARRDQSASFGRYNRVTGACGVEGRAAGRCMQFGFRYEF